MDYLLPHFLKRHAEQSSAKEALVHGQRRLTYSQLWNEVCRLANGLQQHGLCRGERVGIWLGPSVEQVCSIFAANVAQGVFVPIHHSLRSEQATHIAQDCEISCLITTCSQWNSIQNSLSSLSSFRCVILIDEAAAQSDRIVAYHELVDRMPSDPIPDHCNEKDLGAILYTSGSTGKPKGVMLSHANLVAGASIVSDYLNITASDRLLAVLPFTFDAGLNQLTTAVQQGATVVLSRFRFGRDVVKELQQEKITGLAGVPPFWNMLIQPSSRLHGADFPALRYITNTGGAMPQSTLASLREAFPGTDVVLMYGLTEAFRSTYLPPSELDQRPTSMGRAIPNTEILVLDENGQQCPPGTPGELVHHGPTVSLGYWGNDELTAQVLRPHPFPPPGTNQAIKVCYSGDLVKRDEDGFLYFVGRKDNLIKSAGFRISPTEVEQVICRVEEVREAAVIGVPDEMLGQHVHAFVVRTEGESISEAEILDQCAAVLPRYMTPKQVTFLNQLPKTSSGKIDYPGLRHHLSDQTATAESVSEKV